MANWPPAAAYLACGWCTFEGFKREVEGSNASGPTRFDGYAKPAPQAILGSSCKVGDAVLQLSDNAHSVRALLVEDGSATKQAAGCNGYSEFVRWLDYVSYNNVWELPIYHAGQHHLDCIVVMTVCV